nr:VENN motif pre-toxin domain-containing protein [Acinetobacter populi]
MGIFRDFAVSAGLSAPTASGLGIAAATLSPSVSYEIGQYFKGNDAEGSAAHILAHTVLGAAVAAAGGNDALTAGLVAGGSEAAAPKLAQYLYGKDAQDLTADEKSTISAIVGLAGSAVGASTGDVASTVQAGQVSQNAVENNRLQPNDAANYAILVAKYKRDCEGGKTAKHCAQTNNEIQAIINRGKTIEKEEVIDGGDGFWGEDRTIEHKPGDVVGCLTASGPSICQITNKVVNGEYVLVAATSTQQMEYIQKSIANDKKLIELASSAFNNGCSSVGISSTICSAAMEYYGVDPITKRQLTTTERTLYAANAGLNVAGAAVAVKIGVGGKESSSKLELNHSIDSSKISTGRTEPRNLNEKLAMEQVKNNPQGKTPPRMPKMSDSKNNLYAEDGWVKRAQNVNGVEIHYVENTKTGQTIDFKFKD